MSIRLNIKAVLLSTSFVFNSANVAVANTLYEQDFEGGSLPEGVPSPVWSIKQPSLGPVTQPGGMFEVVRGQSHSGEYSLRFNYDGLNGICNICGKATEIHKSGVDNVSYLISETGNDLTQSPYLAATDRIVFNKDNGFSKWRITSISNHNTTNDKLILENVLGSVDGGTNQINSGDSVFIAKACGIDGTIGGNIDRRSDCNRAITYFDGVSQSAGQSIYRRLYFKIGTSTVLPDAVQKLRYWDTTEGSLYVTFERGRNGTLAQIAIGGVVTGMPRMTRPEGGGIDAGIWYYLEEQFKAETSPGANDGEYRLWLSESGNETNTPLIEWTGLGLKPVYKASLWGNHQHFNNTHGYWYFDDFKISNIRNGPVTGLPHPKAPFHHPVQ